jgi:uncharacterized protein YndB with AHSA1/START domain
MTKNSTGLVAEPGKQELFLIREFDAPPERVFRAHVEPEYFVRWFGCQGMSTTVDRFEAKSGGSYRYRQRYRDMPEFTVHGVYHEVLAPERIVRTVEMQGVAGQVLLETARFEKLEGGRTRLTTQSLFPSVAARDGMVGAGVEHGSREAFERLDAVLAAMAR